VKFDIFEMECVIYDGKVNILSELNGNRYRIRCNGNTYRIYGRVSWNWRGRNQSLRIWAEGECRIPSEKVEEDLNECYQ
jgi:hypothetical protein